MTLEAVATSFEQNVAAVASALPAAAVASAVVAVAVIAV